MTLNKTWNWSSCTKFAQSASWTHGLIAQSVRASERNSVVVGSNPTQASFKFQVSGPNVIFYKNILMLKYENVYFNWFEDIREYKYFFQSLLLNVRNRNLFSCRHFKTSSDLLFRSSLWFGYMSIANFSWRHKEHHFVILCMVQQFELFATLMLVFP